jgi:hypothetical protein
LLAWRDEEEYKPNAIWVYAGLLLGQRDPDFKKRKDTVMITNPVLTNQSKSGNGQEPTNIQRRTLIGGALAALFSSSVRLMGEENDERHKDERPNDLFILLLKGRYHEVGAGQGPANNLGLSTVNLSDGSYSRTRIYPIFGLSENPDQDRSIGRFYAQFAGNLCAYDLPGGALAMSFNSAPAGAPPGFNGFVPFPDGRGGNYLEGTFELMIPEATGIYRAFQGGHNHMVDRLHQLSNGGFSEFCFCNISQYQFP